ncbi:MFS transporter [Xanthobacter autotrophicus DSM 431]|uniref:MFS transporter n=1 Tax=Xanthobacter nonsaccharivorans TaxID=3119912 RepID=UPI003729BCC7
MRDFESDIIGKISRRLLPILFLSFVAAYLDRVNVGFAALSMNKDLGFTATAYAIGGGIFFFGYFLFEVPSNMILHRVGARLWIARIMISWGIISGLTAFVWDSTSFYAIRFILGVAEAGFFPGIVLYLTYWFPARDRAKVLGGFLVAVPFAIVFGSPVSGLLLGLDELAGLKGWQWMFFLEAIPSILLGFVVLFALPSRPRDARWLSDAEKAWLQQELTKDEADRAHHSLGGMREALTSRKILLFGLAYVGIITGSYGVVLWLPTMVKGFGLSNAATGFIAAVPYAVAAVTMILWTRNSDRSGERTWHAAFACFLGCGGLAASATLSDPVMQMIALSVAAAGIFTAMPTFWTLPPQFLSGTGLAAGIALINSIGNLGGFLGPYAVGAVKDATGSFTYGLLMLSVFICIAGLLIIVMTGGKTVKSTPVTRPAE